MRLAVSVLLGALASSAIAAPLDSRDVSAEKPECSPFFGHPDRLACVTLANRISQLASGPAQGTERLFNWKEDLRPRRGASTDLPRIWEVGQCRISLTLAEGGLMASNSWKQVSDAMFKIVDGCITTSTPTGGWAWVADGPMLVELSYGDRVCPAAPAEPLKIPGMECVDSTIGLALDRINRLGL